MIVSRTDEKVYYPKRKINDIVLSLEYKYSECHSDNEIYYYSSKQMINRKISYDFYFEARNWKTNKLEAALLAYHSDFKDITNYFGTNSLIIYKLSFNNVTALKYIFQYIHSITAINKCIQNVFIFDLDDNLKTKLNGIVEFYDMHNNFNQMFHYKNKEAFNLKIYGVGLINANENLFEDTRNIHFDNNYSVEKINFADDVFCIDEDNINWDIPVYKYHDEVMGDLVYLNEELPIGNIPLYKVYYKEKIVGYFVHDSGIDFIDNNYVPVDYIYDLYIDLKDDFKYEILKYILNYIKFNSFKWLTTNIVIYKLSDGKDSLINALKKFFNAIEDGDKAYKKYVQNKFF